MNQGSGALLMSPFAIIGLSSYLGDAMHHVLIVVTLLFVAGVLVSGILRRGLELRQKD